MGSTYTERLRSSLIALISILRLPIVGEDGDDYEREEERKGRRKKERKKGLRPAKGTMTRHERQDGWLWYRRKKRNKRTVVDGGRVEAIAGVATLYRLEATWSRIADGTKAWESG